MKIQLDEKTLNAYINEALKQELMENNTDELFGSRHRKNNIRMITGQGWGNQSRDTKNFWGAANTDISATDSESEAPQTLVGIITKLENNLMKLEKFVGLPGTVENLGAGVAQSKNNGKTSVFRFRIEVQSSADERKQTNYYLCGLYVEGCSTQGKH
jgi:hypothetical protein